MIGCPNALDVVSDRNCGRRTKQNGRTTADQTKRRESDASRKRMGAGQDMAGMRVAGIKVGDAEVGKRQRGWERRDVWWRKL